MSSQSNDVKAASVGFAIVLIIVSVFSFTMGQVFSHKEPAYFTPHAGQICKMNIERFDVVNPYETWGTILECKPLTTP